MKEPGAAVLALVAAAACIALACSAEDPTAPDPGTAEIADDELERLAALGYVSGEVPATSESGVTLHDRARVSPGINFVVSGHAPSAALVDMDGNVLHEWRVAFDEVWPGRERPKRLRDAHWLRRAALLPNGDLIGLWAHSGGILKLDRDSRVLWANPIRSHHDLEVMPDGRIYVLTSVNRVVPRVDPKNAIREDFVAVLTPEGRVERQVSLLEAFENSDAYRFIWMLHPDKYGVIFHTNTLAMLDGRIADRMPAFARGRVLTSMRALDTIAVVDLDRVEVVWAHKGGFAEQHDPQVLDDGTLLLFDNLDGPEHSSVEAYAPEDMRLVWAYRGTPEAPFFSRHSGAVQRLPNGNTLITESVGGRAFEVTPEGERVWEYLNPHRARDDAGLRAILYDVQRLAPDFDVSWAKAPAQRAETR